MAKGKVYCVRDPQWTAVKSDACFYLIKGENRVELATENTALLSELIDLLTAPLPKVEFQAKLKLIETSETSREMRDWLVQLSEAGIYLEGSQDQLLAKLDGFITFGPNEKAVKNLVFCVSGSIQSSQIGPSIRKMRASFAENVEVVLTKSAERFFNPESLKRAGVRIWRKMTDFDPAMRVPHSQLAQNADLVLIFPASASTLSRIAQGTCADLTSTIAITTRAPVVIVPVMNSKMWTSPAVQRNIAMLAKDGFYIVHPGPGLPYSSIGSAPGIELGNSGLRLDTPEDLEFILMHLLAIHGESR